MCTIKTDAKSKKMSQKTALISVSNKKGIVDFAKFLIEQNYHLISTGGTYKHLKESGVEVVEVAEVTGFPEILDGRVKTLHPKIHGGILARRSDEKHLQTLKEHHIPTIDMVVVNLYPFFENADKGLNLDELVEFIDIGGPTMLRASAKSFKDVVVITHVEDYQIVTEELQERGEVKYETRQKLAGKVFNLTSAYDAAIAQKLLKEEEFPNYFTGSYKKDIDLRYGENPHQKAAFYVSNVEQGSMKDFIQHQGKALSFNNIRDMDLAYKVVSEFQETCCCAVKHSTPCGVALDANIVQAYQKAHDGDPISIFGGIVAFNQEVTKDLAEKLTEIFLEIVIAPKFSAEALAVFKLKKNLRIIAVTNAVSNQLHTVQVDGGLLIQDADNQFSEDIRTVTEKAPTDQEMKDLIFAQRIIKHVKSNAIVVAANQMALGVGTGETNRIWATQQAIERAKGKKINGLVLASDAFFPFRDVVDTAAKEGIGAIIQPGGSMRDQASIDAANEHQIAMVFTGMRHFLH